MSAQTTTRACPKCSSAISSTSQFCPNCGTAVSGVFSGGGSPMDGTAILAAESVDTVLPILQDATLGHYDIYGELGRGGMAAVYLALDLKLNRKVAIKTMLPELVSREGMVARFRREAQTSAALSHPHIIQIFAVEETEKLVFFVMKYIEGRSLESVILERGKLDVDLTRVVLSQAGAALAFAHRKNVIHRDVKPANIMLEEDGWAIVTDFGIAKVQEAQNLTATGTAIGTPHYMSPEQFHNKAVTGASDQYSLGIVAYEMLTGRKPFDGATYAEIITQHLFETPPDLRELRPDVPVHVAETITRMLSKDAAARFPDLDAAVSALGMPTKTQGDVARTQMISLAKSGPEKKIRMSVPISPVPSQKKKPAARTVVEPTVQSAPAKSNSMRIVLITLGAVLLIAGGVGGTWAYMSRKSGPATQLAANVPNAGVPTQGAASPSASTTTAAVPAVTKQDSTPAVAANPPEVAKPEPAKPTKSKQDDKKAAARNDKAAAKASTPVSDVKASDAAKNAATQQQTAQVAAPAPTVTAPPPAPVAAPTSITGSIRIGSTTDGAILFINGAASSTPVTGGTKTISVTSKDGNVHLKISAAGCSVAWDTTVTIAAGQTTTVGRRNPTCP